MVNAAAAVGKLSIWLAVDRGKASSIRARSGACVIAIAQLPTCDAPRGARAEAFSISRIEDVRRSQHRDDNLSPVGVEVGYWLVRITALGAVLTEGRYLLDDTWPRHAAVGWTLYTVIFIAALAALVIRRQRRNGEPAYSIPRASGLAAAVLFGPVVVMAAIVLMLQATHVWS